MIKNIKKIEQIKKNHSTQKMNNTKIIKKNKHWIWNMK